MPNSDSNSAALRGRKLSDVTPLAFAPLLLIAFLVAGLWLVTRPGNTVQLPPGYTCTMVFERSVGGTLFHWTDCSVSHFAP